jgi:HSP20 family protein
MAHRGLRSGPVFGLRREIDRLFEDTFGGESGRGSLSPAVDIREDSREIAIEVELPGIKPEDVDVTAENGVLTIRGEKRSTSTENTEGRYHIVERSYGTFTRSFQLPTGVDDKAIAAEFNDGLLVVRVPKAALAQPRRIQIRNSGSQPAVQGSPTPPGERPSRSTERQAESGNAGGTSSSRPNSRTRA